MDEQDRDGARIDALREALRGYAAAANERDRTTSNEERAAAERDTEAFREVASAVVTTD